MIDELVKKKNTLGDERDLCAEVYNLWITRLYEHESNKEKYNMYMAMIAMLEPYVNSLKEEMREINRQICDIEGVESIGDTKYTRECNNTHGLDKPNAES